MRRRRRLLIGDRRQRQRRWGGPEPRWTNPQLELFNSPYRCTVWWGANGIGKSLGLAGLTDKALRGALPWQEPGPKTVILAGNTWTQLGSTLKYLWQFVDRRMFAEQVEFRAGGLKGQKLQVYDIVDGPSKGGELRLGTFRAQNLAGPRADVVISDEPLPQAVYDELWPRLLGRGGRLYMGFTTTIGTYDGIDYVWEKVDDPSLPFFGEINTPLTLDAVTPRGGLVEQPWMTQREIDEFEAGCSRLEVAMRMGRSRQPAFGEAYFSAFGPHLVGDCNPPVGARLGVGIDHGSKPGAQRASLVAVSGLDLDAFVWVLDEYKAPGRTNEREDAEGILAMLERNGLKLANIDLWVGDRAHHGDFRGGEKSNTRLLRAIADRIGISVRRRGWISQLPRPMREMHTPYKSHRSDWEGMDQLHRLMGGETPRILFSPRTVWLQRDVQDWRGSKRDPCKDGIDSLRYAVVPMVEGRAR